jgi:hypothetical protein
MSPKTRKEKQSEGKGKGTSKYAQKVSRRRKTAAKLGLPDLPFPVLNSTEKEEASDGEAQA